jgi:hypothetical protein
MAGRRQSFRAAVEADFRMPFFTKQTPPAVFLGLTAILAILATILFGVLFVVADRLGDDADLIARVRSLSAVTAGVSFVVAVLAIVGRRWLGS